MDGLIQGLCRAISKQLADGNVTEGKVTVRQCEHCGSYDTEFEQPSEGLPDGWGFVQCHKCNIGEPVAPKSKPTES